MAQVTICQFEKHFDFGQFASHAGCSPMLFETAQR